MSADAHGLPLGLDDADDTFLVPGVAGLARVRAGVGHGVLERRPYDQRPRHEYHLTAKGAELAGDVDLLPGPGAVR